MRLLYERAWKSIGSAVADEELADFIVLSGPNGSGKSQLLEAIEDGATRVAGVEQRPGVNAVRLFRLAQLVAAAEGPQSAAQFRDRWVQLHQIVEQFKQPGSGHGLQQGSPELDAWVQARLVENRQITQPSLERMLNETGKRIIDFTLDDFRRYSPMLFGVRDPFQLTVGELFLTYHDRRTRNEFLQWRAAEKDDAPEQPLSDDEFVSRYGPPPWTLLNETLELIGLPYEFERPEGIEDQVTYEPRLIDRELSTSVKPDELSSGEKTLLAIAMSLYTGSELGEAIELPEVLLLDEADASLHPSMVQSLLRVTGEIFCGRYGVKVIVTTHSPSTVALAPAESLYTMRRTGVPRLRHTSRDDALLALTIGVPTLSVSVENRRQVFVESEYDEACYQELFRLVRSELASPFSLEFIASGKGGSGGETAVRHLVTSLRSAGNTTVCGIVDRDDRVQTSDGIAFLRNRDSLENLVFDPLPLGIFLLRERAVASQDVGLPDGIRHFEITGQQAQALADYVQGRILSPDELQPTTQVQYVGGLCLNISEKYLVLDGHDLEERLRAAFPPLNAHGTGLKRRVIDRALSDVPEFTPSDVTTLFNEALSASA